VGLLLAAILSPMGLIIIGALVIEWHSRDPRPEGDAWAREAARRRSRAAAAEAAQHSWERPPTDWAPPRPGDSAAPPVP
jgi:hypothetical protein